MNIEIDVIMKPHPESKKHMVRKDGKVWSKSHKLWLKPYKTHANSKHLYYQIGRRRERVANLVLRTFVGPRPKGLGIIHKDGDVTNNHLNNLYYGNRNLKPRLVIFEHKYISEVFFITNHVQLMCKAFGLDYPAVVNILQGRRHSCKGYTARYIGEEAK